VTEYQNRQELILEILNRAKLFIKEFNDIDEKDKDKLIDGVDRTARTYCYHSNSRV